MDWFSAMIDETGDTHFKDGASMSFSGVAILSAEQIKINKYGISE